MNDNLNEMVQENTDETQVFSEADLDLPEETTAEEVTAEAETAPEPEAEETPQPAIRSTTLSTWFDANVERFANISPVRLQIRGVDPAKTLVVAVTGDPNDQDEAGNAKRNLEFIKNADTQPVLDLPADAMDIYSNGFRITYTQGDVQIKGYGTKTGLEITFCKMVNGLAIPYAMTKLKKKDTGLDVPDAPDTIEGWLQQNADTEALSITYRQSSKVLEELTNNQSVATYLCGRQAEIKDINHHVQIDKVFLTLQGLI